MHTIKIDYDKCTSCQICVKACWEDVIRWNETLNKPIVIYPEDCLVCVLCEVLCPAKAIDIIPDWQSRKWPRVISRPINIPSPGDVDE